MDVCFALLIPYLGKYIISSYSLPRFLVEIVLRMFERNTAAHMTAPLHNIVKPSHPEVYITSLLGIIYRVDTAKGAIKSKPR